MLLLSWKLVKKELYHLCWILQMLVQWSFDSEGALLLDCGRVVFATPKDCCYWWCHIFKDFLNFLFGTKIVVDRIFARSLLIALPENKNHLIFDAFVKTLLTKFFRITWKQRTFQFCLLISTRSREAYTWCFRGKRPTSHQPNRMLMRRTKGFSHLHSIRFMWSTVFDPDYIILARARDICRCGVWDFDPGGSLIVG